MLIVLILPPHVFREILFAKNQTFLGFPIFKNVSLHTFIWAPIQWSGTNEINTIRFSVQHKHLCRSHVNSPTQTVE